MEYLTMKEKDLTPVVAELNRLLAEYSVYYQKLRSFHWNVLGENFFDLHEQYEELYSDARTKIDEIAERILTLRYHPVSRLEKYIELAEIKEINPIISDRDMVKETLKDHRIILKQMNSVMESAEAAKDEGTLDIMGSYIADLEKASWMLDAWYRKAHETMKVSSKTLSA